MCVVCIQKVKLKKYTNQHRTFKEMLEMGENVCEAHNACSKLSRVWPKNKINKYQFVGMLRVRFLRLSWTKRDSWGTKATARRRPKSSFLSSLCAPLLMALALPDHLKNESKDEDLCRQRRYFIYFFILRNNTTPQQGRLMELRWLLISAAVLINYLSETQIFLYSPAVDLFDFVCRRI